MSVKELMEKIAQFDKPYQVFQVMLSAHDYDMVPGRQARYEVYVSFRQIYEERIDSFSVEGKTPKAALRAAYRQLQDRYGTMSVEG